MVVARSDEAERFLQSELVQNFFNETEWLLVQRWQNTQEDQTEQRERIYNSIHLLNAFKLYLESAIDDGKMAAFQLDAMLTGQHDRAKEKRDGYL
jgi:hypothetical protein